MYLESVGELTDHQAYTYMSTVLCTDCIREAFQRTPSDSQLHEERTSITYDNAAEQDLCISLDTD